MVDSTAEQLPEKEQVEKEQAAQRRRDRKAGKKKHAAARESFIEDSTGFVDRDALRSSLMLLMEREGLLFDDEVTLESEEPLGGDSATEAETEDDASRQPRARRARPAPAPMAFPANNTNRWNPIGPSVVRQGQATGRPRVSGRIRDLAVSANGTRAYAATAKGGVWYTGDGGATWQPVGGWANETRRSGGNTSVFACGCLLVNFGVNAAADFVMAGTGEIGAFQGPANAAPMRGMGILAGTGPANQALQADPWETSTGIGNLEGFSIARMVRVPGSAAGQAGDRVIAATSGGLFMGTRSMVGGNLQFTWAAMQSPTVPGAPAAPGIALLNRDPTDLVYVGARLFVCFRSTGVAASDDHGATFRWVNTAVNPPATSRLTGRLSIAVNDDGNRVYVLGEVNTNPGVAGNTQVPNVWQITNPSVAFPTVPNANPMANVPNNGQLWPAQRDYDQAIMVTTRNVGAPAVRTDRVYIGGSLVWVTGQWNASIWAFDVNGVNLVPSPGVSDQPAGTTHGADVAGLVGNAVHPDVHCLRKATNADGTRQVWVGCDGGTFVSIRDGQTNTFAPRNVGLASIETEFVACHPTSSHFAMLGCQDNGRQVRVGESVWELKTTMMGDGGGVTFHPIQSHYVMGQFAAGAWECDPASRYVPPIAGPANTDPEGNASAFYSGIDTIIRPPGNRARIALGTNRVWITDNLGSANPNTWRVLPITAPGVFAAWRDPRPGTRFPSTPANQAFGVPAGPALGSVITVKWINPTTLVALYRRGIIRYQENAGSPGQWTSTTLMQPGMAAPAAPLVIPTATFFTDIEPVPGTNDFYLIGTGQTTQWTPAVPATTASAAVAAIAPTAAADSCFYFDNAAGGFRTTGLGQALPPPPPFAASPIDPAYSVVVDPSNVNVVYVGTATAVWRSTKNAGPNTHGAWAPFVNGLPESTVQDLKIWTDPAAGAGSPRLLRAALQSRGVWEVNLAAQEPVRTYVRVHERDDRRMFPTPMKNPRRRPSAADVSAFRSPDITVRPQTPVTNTPSFRGTNITNGNLAYQLWTFQTAFRWLYPSVVPNGEWSDQFGDLVERHRRSLAMSGARRIDAALWNSVMAAARDETGSPGVYRAPWQNAIVPNQPASEIDMMEAVVPRRNPAGLWQVYRERSIIDVLLHHRDTRPVTANNAFAVVLWRSHRSFNTLRATDCTNIIPYVRSLVGGGAALPVPAGWNVALTGGNPLHRLAVPLAARMPMSVSANVDFSTVANGRRVLLLAISGSDVDQFSAVPSGAIDRVDRFVRHWPHAAARMISVWSRPGTQLFP